MSLISVIRDMFKIFIPQHTKYFSFLFVSLSVFLSHPKLYQNLYCEDPLMDFIHIDSDGRYRSKI